MNTDFAVFLLSAVGLWAGMFVYSVSKDVQADLDIISIYTVYENDLDANPTER